MLHFITEPFFESGATRHAVLQQKSRYGFDYGQLPQQAIQLHSNGPELVNGNFWVGSKYLLVGVWEFQQCNNLHQARMRQLTESVKTFFSNAEHYPVIWVQTASPVNYEGTNYYLPFLHLDDFMCPIASNGGVDTFLYAEVDEAYCINENEAIQAGTLAFYKTMLQQAEEKLSADLQALNVTPSFIKLPVLFDSFLNRIYSYTNCLVEQVNGETMVHLPRYRKDNDAYFNEKAMLCETVIESRLQQIATVKFMEGYSFQRSVAEGMGGMHCILSAYSRV